MSASGMSKMSQPSPTSAQGQTSYTHPAGSPLPALDPISVTLGIANASFVAQTVDWNPAHVMATGGVTFHIKLTLVVLLIALFGLMQVVAKKAREAQTPEAMGTVISEMLAQSDRG